MAATTVKGRVHARMWLDAPQRCWRVRRPPTPATSTPRTAGTTPKTSPGRSSRRATEIAPGSTVARTGHVFGVGAGGELAAGRAGRTRAPWLRRMHREELVERAQTLPVVGELLEVLYSHENPQILDSTQTEAASGSRRHHWTSSCATPWPGTAPDPEPAVLLKDGLSHRAGSARPHDNPAGIPMSTTDEPLVSRRTYFSWASFLQDCS